MKMQCAAFNVPEWLWLCRSATTTNEKLTERSAFHKVHSRGTVGQHRHGWRADRPRALTIIRRYRIYFLHWGAMTRGSNAEPEDVWPSHVLDLCCISAKHIKNWQSSSQPVRCSSMQFHFERNRSSLNRYMSVVQSVVHGLYLNNSYRVDSPLLWQVEKVQFELGERKGGAQRQRTTSIGLMVPVHNAV